MGGFLSRINDPLKNYSECVTNIISGRKRKREDDDSDSGDELLRNLGKSLNTPVM